MLRLRRAERAAVRRKLAALSALKPDIAILSVPARSGYDPNFLRFNPIVWVGNKPKKGALAVVFSFKLIHPRPKSSAASAVTLYEQVSGRDACGLNPRRFLYQFRLEHQSWRE